MADYKQQVIVGERTLPIPRFTGFKAKRAGAILARLGRASPELEELAATFRTRYRERNRLQITRAMAKMPRFAREDGSPLFSDEDFAGRDYVEIPAEPDGNELLMALFPFVWEKAEPEVVQLLALVLIPNTELRQADLDDQVDDKLRSFGTELLHEGSVEELLEAILIAGDVLREQFRGKRERLGLLMSILRGRQDSTETTEARSDSSPTRTSSETSSSTDSPPPTDGQPSTPSTGSRGERLSV
jgi:hypothetical protein